MGEDKDVRAPELGKQCCAFGNKAWSADVVAEPELVKAGVTFDIHGLVVQPGHGVLITLVIGATFFGLCVNQFRKADFSRVTVFKRGQHR